MKTTLIRNIFREIQPEGHSFSMARRVCVQGDAMLNGKEVSFFDEVEVHEGDIFRVGKNSWNWKDGSWQKNSPQEK